MSLFLLTGSWFWKCKSKIWWRWLCESWGLAP